MTSPGADNEANGSYCSTFMVRNVTFEDGNCYCLNVQRNYLNMEKIYRNPHIGYISESVSVPGCLCIQCDTVI